MGSNVVSGEGAGIVFATGGANQVFFFFFLNFRSNV
jgi:hypothetical protein